MDNAQIIEHNEFDLEPEVNVVNLIELLIVVAKRKRLIVGAPIAAGALAAAISFALPDVYKASTTLLPPQQQSGAEALLSQLGGAASVVAGAAGIKNPNELYVGMLSSRTIGDKLIARFNLKKVYETDSLEKARAALKAHTAISAGKDGLITIEVDAEDKKLVAPLTNSYVDELLKLTKVMAVTGASQRRLFFERQLELSKNNLANAEMTLKKGLDARGVISIDSDSRAMVETVGRLRAQISAKEIQLGSMQAFVTATNPEYRRAKEDLSSLRDELNKLENGRPQAEGERPQQAVKQVGLENIKLLRDVKYYQMLYELLAKQYEAARLDEARDGAVIQVLDSAIEPERKFKPKRAIIIAISTVFGLFAAIGLAFFMETKEKALQSPDKVVKWQELLSYLKARPAK